MEFFFYSKTKAKAIDLKQDLENLGIEVYGIEKSSGQQYSIGGITPPMNLAEDNFKAWIKIMNETGFINDCEFDGWGTISLPDEAEPFQNS